MKKSTKTKSMLPQRHFCTGDKTLVSVRMYETLLKELKKIAEQRQWDFSEVVMTALDQYVQENEQ